MTSRAVVTINTDADRDRVARWAMSTGVGTVVEFRKKSRSTEQNAKLHAMLSEVSEQVEWYGRKLSPTDWKNMFTASLQKANVVPGIDAGTVVTIGVSTSAMTIDEMSNLIELIYAFGAQPEHLVTFQDTDTGASASLAPVTEAEDHSSGPASLEPAATSADSAAGSSVSADVSPADQESAEPPLVPATAADSNSLLPKSFKFAGDDLTYLKEFATKAIKAASDGKQSEAYRQDQFNRMADAYSNDMDIRLSSDAIEAINAMEPAIRGVWKGREPRLAREYVAREILGCDPLDLEGRR